MFWKQKNDGSSEAAERSVPAEKQNSSVEGDSSALEGSSVKDKVTGRESAPANKDPIGNTAVHSSTHLSTGPQPKLGYCIPRGYTVIGNPRFSGAVTIDGALRGTVRSDSIYVTRSGALEGRALAREIIIEGTVRDEVKATGQVVLRAGSEISGIIETPAIDIGPEARIVNAQMNIG